MTLGNCAAEICISWMLRVRARGFLLVLTVWKDCRLCAGMHMTLGFWLGVVEVGWDLFLVCNPGRLILLVLWVSLV